MFIAESGMMVGSALTAINHALKRMKHRNYCQEKDCACSVTADWDGKFLKHWYCKKHKKKQKQ